MAQTKLELTNQIIELIAELGNLYYLGLVKQALEAELAIRHTCLEVKDAEYLESLNDEQPAVKVFNNTTLNL